MLLVEDGRLSNTPTHYLNIRATKWLLKAILFSIINKIQVNHTAHVQADQKVGWRRQADF